MKNTLANISLLLRDFLEEPAADSVWLGIESFFEQNRDEKLCLVEHTVNKTLHRYRIESQNKDMKYVIVLSNNKKIVSFTYEPMSLLTRRLLETIKENIAAAQRVDPDLYNELNEIIANKKLGDRVPSWVAG